MRVRGYLLHKLAEIGHHRHPFRLKFKGEYLKDGLTLEESKIYDSVALEIVPLATYQVTLLMECMLFILSILGTPG